MKVKYFCAVVLVAAPVLGLSLDVQAQTGTLQNNLSWMDNSNNEERFYVYRDNVRIGEVAANVTTFQDIVTGPWKQQFCYQVSAANHANVDGTGTEQESAKTNQACATIPVPTQAAPTAPSNLINTGVTQTSLRLQWNDNATNETSQEIRVSQSTPPRIWTVPVQANVTTYRVDGLKKNTQHRVKVRAVGDGGVSDYSNEIIATTKK